MLIAQITDTHLTQRGQLAHNTVDTLPRLKSVITSLHSMSMKPDVILLTGDIADNMHPDAYAELAKLRSEFPAPVFLIPGNHDNRTLMRDAFDDLLGTGEDFIHYVVDDYPVRLIALDTLMPNFHKGELCQDRLSWLEAELAKAPTRPTLLFMHHPPFRHYINEMDEHGLDGSEQFAEIVERNPQIKRILCGHVHRSIHTIVGNVLCSVAPSVGFNQALGLGPDGQKGFHPGRPKYLLHIWNDTEFVTHMVTPDDQTPSIQYAEEIGT